MTTASDDMWARLKRLDHCCEVHVGNSGPSSGGPWTGRVTTRTQPPESFEVRGATMVEAVVLLVAEAERRGWPG